MYQVECRNVDDDGHAKNDIHTVDFLRLSHVIQIKKKIP